MKKILLLLASVAVLFSCGNKGDNTDPVVPTPEEQASLTVDVTELAFVAEGEAKTIKISTNKDWKVSTTADSRGPSENIWPRWLLEPVARTSDAGASAGCSLRPHAPTRGRLAR